MTGESGSVGSGDDSATSSPKSKIKIFCSYGGKILPRTGDGVLKYVGGESRVIGVSRDITFSDFMKKVSPLTGNDMIFKYQLVPEDLDALVTVRSEADLQHMFDEHDRLGNGAAMLRAFLFPSKPIVLENQSFVSEPHILEQQQRYVDAINGILHICSPRGKPVTVVSSVCSSPKNLNSPDGHSAAVTPDSLFLINNSTSSLHRVHSSPSFSSLTNFQGSLNSPKYQNSYHHHHHHHHHHHPPYGHPFVRRSPDPPAGFGFGRPQPVLSLPGQDNGRFSGFNMPYSPTNSNSSKCGSGLPSPSSGQHVRFDRSNSSPRALNPNPTWES